MFNLFFFLMVINILVGFGLTKEAPNVYTNKLLFQVKHSARHMQLISTGLYSLDPLLIAIVLAKNVALFRILEYLMATFQQREVLQDEQLHCSIILRPITLIFGNVWVITR